MLLGATLSVSTIILVIDTIIIAISGIVFGNFTITVYSAVALYISSVVTDTIVTMGDAAKGVNGVVSLELEAAIKSYLHHYGIRRNQFIFHIEMNTVHGRLPEPSEISYI